MNEMNKILQQIGGNDSLPGFKSHVSALEGRDFPRPPLSVIMQQESSSNLQLASTSRTCRISRRVGVLLHASTRPKVSLLLILSKVRED